MCLISPGGENLLDFLELRQELSTYDGDLRDPLWWPQERPVPMPVAQAPLMIPRSSMLGLRTCVESVPEPEDSCQVLTWIMWYFRSLHRVVSPRLEWRHTHALSFRAAAEVPRFPSRVSRDLWLSLETFPRSFPTVLSHVPPWCESILGVKVEAVQGIQVSLVWTETSGGLWNGGTTLEFLSPFLWRAPPLEMGRKCREFFPDHAGKGSLPSS